MTYDRLIKLYLWLNRRPDPVPGSWTYRKLGRVVARIKQMENERV